MEVDKGNSLCPPFELVSFSELDVRGSHAYECHVLGLKADNREMDVGDITVIGRHRTQLQGQGIECSQSIVA